MALGSTFLPVRGRSSCRLRWPAGILNRTQCTQVPAGASGSSMMRAKDWAPAGGSPQVRAGETFFPTQEYFAGMDCPFTKASLFRSRDMSASGVGVDLDEQEDNRMPTPIEITKSFFIKYLPVRHLRTAE